MKLLLRDVQVAQVTCCMINPSILVLDVNVKICGGSLSQSNTSKEVLFPCAHPEPYLFPLLFDTWKFEPS